MPLPTRARRALRTTAVSVGSALTGAATFAFGQTGSIATTWGMSPDLASSLGATLLLVVLPGSAVAVVIWGLLRVLEAA